MRIMLAFLDITCIYPQNICISDSRTQILVVMTSIILVLSSIIGLVEYDW